jgi:hypothetical protein
VIHPSSLWKCGDGMDENPALGYSLKRRAENTLDKNKTLSLVFHEACPVVFRVERSLFSLLSQTPIAGNFASVWCKTGKQKQRNKETENQSTRLFTRHESHSEPDFRSPPTVLSNLLGRTLPREEKKRSSEYFSHLEVPLIATVSRLMPWRGQAQSVLRLLAPVWSLFSPGIPLGAWKESVGLAFVTAAELPISPVRRRRSWWCVLGGACWYAIEKSGIGLWNVISPGFTRLTP